MKKMQRLLALSLMVVLTVGTWGSAAFAESETFSCIFYGWVYDEAMRPVKDVHITLETPEPDMIPIEDVYADTDALGYWELSMPKGEYRFLFDHPSHEKAVYVFLYNNEIDDLVLCKDVILLPRLAADGTQVQPVPIATIDPTGILQGAVGDAQPAINPEGILMQEDGQAQPEGEPADPAGQAAEGEESSADAEQTGGEAADPQETAASAIPTIDPAGILGIDTPEENTGTPQGQQAEDGQQASLEGDGQIDTDPEGDITTENGQEDMALPPAEGEGQATPEPTIDPAGIINPEIGQEEETQQPLGEGESATAEPTIDPAGIVNPEIGQEKETPPLGEGESVTAEPTIDPAGIIITEPGQEEEAQQPLGEGDPVTAEPTIDPAGIINTEPGREDGTQPPTVPPDGILTENDGQDGTQTPADEVDQNTVEPLIDPSGILDTGTEQDEGQPGEAAQEEPQAEPTPPTPSQPNIPVPGLAFLHTDEDDEASQEEVSPPEQPAPLAAPVLEQEGDILYGGQAVIAWQAVENAAYYRVTLRATANMQEEPLLNESRTEDTSFALPEEALADGQIYEASVIAVGQAADGQENDSEAALMVFTYEAQAEDEKTVGTLDEIDGAQPPEEVTALDQHLAGGPNDPVIADIGHTQNRGQIAITWSAVAAATQYKVTIMKSAQTIVNQADTGAAAAYTASLNEIGLYAITVEAFSGAARLGASEAYVFTVVDPAYTPHPAWTAGDTTTVYVNDNDTATINVALPKGTQVNVVGRNSAGTYYQIQLASGDYGYVRLEALGLVQPMAAPSQPVITIDENDPFVTVTVTPVDPRPATYLVSVYAGTPEALVYIDAATAMPYRIRQALYDTPCRVEVVARAADVTQGIPDSAPAVNTFTRVSPTNMAAAPVMAGDIAKGFLLHGASNVEWNAIWMASGYEWKVMGRDGLLKAGGQAQTNTLAATELIGLTPDEAYTFAIRTTMQGMSPSHWTVLDFTLVGATTPFISDFTMSSNQVTPGSTVTFQLLGKTLPKTSKLVIVSGGAASEYPVTISADGKVTTRFDQAGVYEVSFANDGQLPATASKTLTVANTPVTLTITEIGAKEKSKTFNIQWTAVPGAASYSLVIMHLDGTLQFPATNLTSNTYAVPATSVPKIGPYTVTVTAQTGAVTNPTATVAFQIVDAAFKSFSGKIKETATLYQYAGNNSPIGQLSKDQTVTVIGELDGYYHIRMGTSTTGGLTDTALTAGTGTQQYAFVIKDAVSGSSTSSGGSGGGSGGGGTRGGTSANVNTTMYKAAFGSEEERRESYAYVPGLYEPLMQRMADPEDEVVAQPLHDLLVSNFGLLPKELNTDEYKQVRERAAWSQVTAYLTLLTMQAATDEVIGRQDAMQVLAAYLVETIDALLPQEDSEESSIDESIRKVLEEVREQALKVAESSTAGTLQGTNVEIAISVLARIFNTLPYDDMLLEEMPKAFDPELNPDIKPDEPMEVKFLRLLYALTEYQQSKLTIALDALPDAAKAADITAVQDAYLDYVFVVARLHMLSFSMGKGAAEVVVQNWGKETNRLIEVAKLYQSLAQ